MFKMWQKVMKTEYEIFRQAISGQGVFPDFAVKANGEWRPVPPNDLESKYDGDMYYNACRVPWRLSAAALEYKDSKALQLLIDFNRGIGKVTNDKFKSGYKLSGEIIGNYTSGAFTAPHMCSLLVNKRQADFSAAFKKQLKERTDYYSDSIRMNCLILVSKKQE